MTLEYLPDAEITGTIIQKYIIIEIILNLKSRFEK